MHKPLRTGSAIRGAAALLVLAGLLGLNAPGAEAGENCIPRAECCKVCSAGKACGNSCISRAKNCHKGRGYACDAEEICR